MYTVVVVLVRLREKYWCKGGSAHFYDFLPSSYTRDCNSGVVKDKIVSVCNNLKEEKSTDTCVTR